MIYPQARVLLFARLPESGRVKTRLIPALGAEGACRLHRRLLAHQLQMCEQQTLCPAELWLDRLSEEEVVPTTLPIREQRGDDLGARMLDAVTETFTAGAEAVVIIGSDCPDLSAEYLHSALQALERGADLVLGAARDGGYVLIGLAAARASLFNAMPWGSATVLAETLKRAQEAELCYEVLPALADIDEPADLACLPGNSEYWLSQ